VQFQFFDPDEEVSIQWGQLPHWDQPGTLCFLTWRTIDSIPRAVLRRWRVERAVWLRKYGIDPLSPDWR
jgi:putative transposase